jgi:hypothetical protein
MRTARRGKVRRSARSGGMKLHHFAALAVLSCLVSACGTPDSAGLDLVETHDPSGKTTQSIVTKGPRSDDATTIVQSALRDRPGLCVACVLDCPRTPTMEPLGQICWLIASDCSCSGVRGCYYHCEPIDEPLTRL